MSISVLISTIGRDSLINMLESLKPQLTEIDYLYVIVDGSQYHEKVKNILDKFIDYKFNLITIYEDENFGFWGHGIRNKYQSSLKGDYILHGDDDDTYLDGAIDIVRKYTLENTGKMLLFKFHKNNEYFWRYPKIELNNIGTPCGCIPNIPDKMGEWGYRYGGDFDFYNTCSFENIFIDEYIYKVEK